MTVRKYFLLLSLMLAVTQLHAAGAKAQLEAFISGADTFQADFTQTLVDTASHRSQVTSGRLYVQRPGQFRWEYFGEEAQLIVADGKRIWLVEPDLQQVSHRSQKAALRGTPAWILTGNGDLDQEFILKELSDTEGLYWLELLPRDPESQFEKILLALKDNNLYELKMADKFGQLTEYKFSQQQTNLALDKKLFDYQPPDEFDLIDD